MADIIFDIGDYPNYGGTTTETSISKNGFTYNRCPTKSEISSAGAIVYVDGYADNQLVAKKDVTSAGGRFTISGFGTALENYASEINQSIVVSIRVNDNLLYAMTPGSRTERWNLGNKLGIHKFPQQIDSTGTTGRLISGTYYKRGYLGNTISIKVTTSTNNAMYVVFYNDYGTDAHTLGTWSLTTETVSGVKFYKLNCTFDGANNEYIHDGEIYGISDSYFDSFFSAEGYYLALSDEQIYVDF